MILPSLLTRPMPSVTVRRPTALLAVELVVGINAVAGGIGLMINGLGMPRSQLDGSPFDSYAIPGFVLAVAVGGSALSAAWAVWTRRRIAPVLSVLAGSTVIGWMLVQLAMLGYISLLQPIILGFGLLIVGLSYAWIRTTRLA